MTYAIAEMSAEFSDTDTYIRQEQGVYLLLLRNGTKFESYDRNGHGKLLVRPRAWMVKAGKFEGGLSSRMCLNYAHFHLRDGDREVRDGVFPSMVQWLLVHFMNGQALSEVRATETRLKRGLRHLLKQQSLNEVGQDGRSESRRLAQKPPNDFKDQAVAMMERAISMA